METNEFQQVSAEECEDEGVAALARMSGEQLRLLRDPSAPKLYSIWLNHEGTEDIVGAGDTVAEALEEARAELL